MRIICLTIAGLFVLSTPVLAGEPAERIVDIEPKKGVVEAKGPDKKQDTTRIPVAGQDAAAAARARRQELCSSLYPPPGKERDKRSKYKKWIKKLICDYMVADYTTPKARNDYVRRVFGALRKNAGGAWALPKGAPVVHIVTVEPAYRFKKDKAASAIIVKIKSQSIRRSLRNPNAASVGIVKEFFVTPKARNADEADQRIAKAEDLIQRILGLAVVADLIAGNPGATSKKKANARVKAALKAFRKLVLTEASKTKFEGGAGIKPRPRGAPKVGAGAGQGRYVPPGPNVGRNVLRREPAKRPAKVDEPIRINKIKKKVSITRAIIEFTMRDIPKIRKLIAVAKESIEPHYKFRRTQNLRVIVRTMIVIERFAGLPRGSKAIGVLSKRGKDCTKVIRAHEEKHIAHHWDAWKTKVIDKIKSDLNELGTGFKNLKEKRVRVLAVEDTKTKNIGGTKMNVTYLDIYGEFVFPGKKRSSAEKARKAINKAFKKVRIKKNVFKKNKLTNLKAMFEKRANTLGAIYHKEFGVGLDDDCKPVRDPAKARALFGNAK